MLLLVAWQARRAGRDLHLQVRRGCMDAEPAISVLALQQQPCWKACSSAKNNTLDFTDQFKCQGQGQQLPATLCCEPGLAPPAGMRRALPPADPPPWRTTMTMTTTCHSRAQPCPSPSAPPTCAASGTCTVRDDRRRCRAGSEQCARVCMCMCMWVCQRAQAPVCECACSVPHVNCSSTSPRKPGQRPAGCAAMQAPHPLANVQLIASDRHKTHHTNRTPTHTPPAPTISIYNPSAARPKQPPNPNPRRTC